MILDKVENLNRYMGHSENLDAAILYLKDMELREIPIGKSSVAGGIITCTVVDHTLAAAPDYWEVHRKNIDIHIVICGREKICIARDKEMLWTAQPYDAESDSVIIKDEITDGEELHLHSGDVMILFPGELHKTNCPCDAGDYVRKMILKVLEDSCC